MSDRVVTLSDQYCHASLLKYLRGRTDIVSSLIPSAGGGSPKTALDIGCGGGVFTKMLSAKGYECLGIDTDRERIETAQKDFGTERSKFEVQDATQLKCPSKSYDVVLCLEVIEHLGNPEHLLTEIRRVTKPEGLVVFSTPNRCSPEGLAGMTLQRLGGRKWNAWDPTHVTIFSSSEFLRLLRDNGLEPVRVVGYCYFPSVYRFKSWTFPAKVQDMFDFLRYAHSARPLLNQFGFNLNCACVLQRPKKTDNA